MYHNKQHLLLLYFCASLFITMDAAAYTPPNNKAIQENLLHLLLPEVGLAYEQASNVTNNKKVLKEELQNTNNKVTAIVNKSYKGYNVIHLIAETGDIDLWNLLSQHTLINRKQCNRKDGSGWAPIHYAAFYNHDNILQKLLDMPRLNINIATEKEQALALHLAAHRNASAILEVLENYKKTKKGKHLAIHKKDNTGRTAQYIYKFGKGVKHKDIKNFLGGSVVQTSPKSKKRKKPHHTSQRRGNKHSNKNAKPTPVSEPHQKKPSYSKGYKTSYGSTSQAHNNSAKNPNNQPFTVLNELNNKYKPNNKETFYGSTSQAHSNSAKNPNNQPITVLGVLNELNNEYKPNNSETSYGSITTTGKHETYDSNSADKLIRILNNLFTIGVVSVIGVVLYVVCKFVFLNIRHMLKP